MQGGHCEAGAFPAVAISDAAQRDCHAVRKNIGRLYPPGGHRPGRRGTARHPVLAYWARGAGVTNSDFGKSHVARWLRLNGMKHLEFPEVLHGSSDYGAELTGLGVGSAC